MGKNGIVIGNSLPGGDRTTQESDDSSDCDTSHDGSMLPPRVEEGKDGSNLLVGDRNSKRSLSLTSESDCKQVKIHVNRGCSVDEYVSDPDRAHQLKKETEMPGAYFFPERLKLRGGTEGLPPGLMFLPEKRKGTSHEGRIEKEYPKNTPVGTCSFSFPSYAEDGKEIMETLKLSPKPPGMTSSSSAGAAMLLAGSCMDSIYMKVPVRPSSVLVDNLYSLSSSIGNIVVNSNQVYFPQDILSIESEVKDFYFVDKSGEVVWSGSGKSRLPKTARALIQLNGRNNDSRFRTPEGMIVDGTYYVVNITKYIYDLCIERMGKEQRRIITFSFPLKSINQSTPKGAFLPSGMGDTINRNITDLYSKDYAHMSVCGGPCEMSNIILNIIAGINSDDVRGTKLLSCFGRLDPLTHICNSILPEHSCIIEKIGRFDEVQYKDMLLRSKDPSYRPHLGTETHRFSSRDEVISFSTLVNSSSFLNGISAEDLKTNAECGSVLKAIYSGLEHERPVFSHDVKDWEDSKFSGSVEDIKHPASAIAAASVVTRTDTYATPLLTPSCGYLPITIVPYEIAWKEYIEMDIHLPLQMMTNTGGVVAPAKRTVRGCSAEVSLLRDPLPEDTIPVLGLGGDLSYHFFNGSADVALSLREGIRLGGIFGIARKVLTSTVEGARWPIPMLRDVSCDTSKIPKSYSHLGVFSSVSNSVSNDPYYSLPVLVTLPNSSRELLKAVRRFNGLMMTYSRGLQYVVKKICKLNFSYPDFEHKKITSENCPIKGLLISKVDGARYLKLVGTNKIDVYELQISEELPLLSKEALHIILCRVYLRSSIVMSRESILHFLLGKDHSVDMGRDVVRKADIPVTAHPLSYVFESPSYVGRVLDISHSQDLDRVTVALKKLGKTVLGPEYLAIDSKGTYRYEQAYRMPSTGGVEIAIPYADISFFQDLRISKYDSGFYVVDQQKNSLVFLIKENKVVKVRSEVIEVTGAVDIIQLFVLNKDLVVTGSDFLESVNIAVDEYFSSLMLKTEFLMRNPNRSEGQKKFIFSDSKRNYFSVRKGMDYTSQFNMRIAHEPESLLTILPSIKEMVSTALSKSGPRDPKREFSMSRKDIDSSEKVINEHLRIIRREDLRITSKNYMIELLLNQIEVGEEPSILEGLMPRHIISELIPKAYQEVKTTGEHSYNTCKKGDEKFYDKLKGFMKVVDGKLTNEKLSADNVNLWVFWNRAKGYWEIDTYRQLDETLAAQGFSSLTADSRETRESGSIVHYVILRHKRFPFSSEGSCSKWKSARSVAAMNWLLNPKRPSLELIAPRDTTTLSYDLYMMESVDEFTYNKVICSVDTEWDPDFPEKMTMLTMCMGGKAYSFDCYSDVPTWAKKVLKDPSVIKYGFDLESDMKLLKSMGVDIEAEDLVKASSEEGLSRIGLAALLKYRTGFTMGEKLKSVSVSFRKGIRWKDLTRQQKVYLAEDVVSVLEIAKSYGKDISSDFTFFVTKEVFDLRSRSERNPDARRDVHVEYIANEKPFTNDEIRDYPLRTYMPDRLIIATDNFHILLDKVEECKYSLVCQSKFGVVPL